MVELYSDAVVQRRSGTEEGGGDEERSASPSASLRRPEDEVPRQRKSGRAGEG
jgi:hypothetical protein